MKSHDEMVLEIESLADQVNQLEAENAELRKRCCRYAEEAMLFKSECESYGKAFASVEEALNSGDGTYHP